MSTLESCASRRVRRAGGIPAGGTMLGHTTIGSVTDSTYSAGQVGRGICGYHAAQYDHFAIAAG